MNHVLIKQVIKDSSVFMYLHILPFHHWFLSNFIPVWLARNSLCGFILSWPVALLLQNHVCYSMDSTVCSALDWPGLTGLWYYLRIDSPSISCLILPIIEEGVDSTVGFFFFFGCGFILWMKHNCPWYSGASWYKYRHLSWHAFLKIAASQ